MRRGKPAKKYSQAGRVHDLIRLIEARHGTTIEELAEESDVSRRTIHRDLIAIQEAGYPLVSEWQGNRKVYRFLTRFKDVPPISFTLQELMTLSFVRSQLDFLRGTPFGDDMESISRKVNSVLPSRYAAHLERIAAVTIPLLQGRRDYSGCGDRLRDIREALLYQYRLNLGYRAQGRGRNDSYTVDPYGLVFHKGGLYLIGYAHNRSALRTFAVERICCVEICRERFEIPEEFRPEEQFRAAFGIVDEPPLDVSVRFVPAIAHTLRERIWHPSQTLQETNDGGVILSFAAGGKMEILSWLLSYGSQAEVLSPPSLREEVAATIGSMERIYGVEVGYAPEQHRVEA